MRERRSGLPGNHQLSTKKITMYEEEGWAKVETVERCLLRKIEAASTTSSKPSGENWSRKKANV